jgi:hypothetical protein
MGTSGTQMGEISALRSRFSATLGTITKVLPVGGKSNGRHFERREEEKYI